MAGGNAYSLVHEHKNGWNPEAFRERFSEVLERYDYIVGDWGYNQLRLRGFFRNQQPKAAKDSVISSLSEYINEYCNFGCAYFVLEKTDLGSVPEGTKIVAEDAAIGARKEGDEPADDDEAAPAALSMAEAVAAAMAASPTGMLLRWPLKERPGGRVPGTSPSAVARAVSEGAERRAAAAAAQGGATVRPDSPGGRSSHEAGGHGFGGGRSRGDGSAQGRDRRPHHSGGPGPRNGGRQDRGPGGGGDSPRGGSSPYPAARDGYGERQGRQAQQSGGSSPAQAPQPSPSYAGEGGHASRGGGSAGGGGAGGGRWAGKNRRRGGSFHGGKPNRPRPEDGQRFEGAARRPDTGSSGGDRP
ncbi:YutD family protein [Cohnella zeiphila]|nr:YutD family protein [Cohnella zeiphila]